MSDSGSRRRRSGRASLAIDNLRGYVILLVLAFHASLAYLAFLPAQPFGFDRPPFEWRAFPIIDSQRSVGLELFCAWQDVFLMTLFFFLSGLFVWSSLKRKGVAAFVADRIERLGLPFAVAVGLLMPVALYPTYLQTTAEPGIGAYLRHFLSLPLWPCGPMWFLWLLLSADLLAACMHRTAPHWGELLGRWSAAAGSRPVRYFGWLAAGSAIAYVPLALAVTPQAWGQLGPFALQLSRPAHYAVYFFAGAGFGAYGIERGLFSPEGALTRHWRLWVVLALGSFALWLAASSRIVAAGSNAPIVLQLAADLSFVVACLCNCFAVLALALRFAARPHRWLGQLKDSAYGMYLVHYLFVVWLQYALLPASLPGAAKAGIVFTTTVVLSWTATAAARQLPRLMTAAFGSRSASIKPS